MDLPTKAIVDLDFALKQGISDGYLLADDTDIVACKIELSSIADLNNITVGSDGWPEKSPVVSAAKAFSILASSANTIQNIENICSKMKVHNIWVWKKGTIEEHLNLQAKNEATWANFANTLENTTLSIMLPSDHQELENCVQWLLN